MTCLTSLGELGSACYGRVCGHQVGLQGRSIFGELRLKQGAFQASLDMGRLYCRAVCCCFGGIK